MESGKIETTIFFGNGVNLLSKEGKSWDDILRQISMDQVISSIPNTLKYESIVLPRDIYTDGYEGVEIRINGILEKLLVDTELFIKEKLAEELIKSKASYYYEKLANLRADNYITTNYEHFICDSLLKHGCKKGGGYNKPKRRLAPHFSLERNGQLVRIWNIHGAVEDEGSILLGLYEYSKYVTDIEKVLKPIEQKSPDVNKSSWPYVMLHSDVHMLGFGLGYEEIDIWYILTFRKRLIRKEIIPRNRFFYYSIMDKGYDTNKMELLKTLDVDVVPINFDWSENAYEKAYNEIYKRIREQVKNVEIFIP